VVADDITPPAAIMEQPTSPAGWPAAIDRAPDV